MAGEFTRFTEYDGLGRVVGQYLSMDNSNGNVSVGYEYPNADGNKERALPSGMRIQGELFGYKYDRNGNITEIQRVPRPDSTESIKKDTFQYDERNQLIRENSQSQDKTIVYAYDQGGNLLSVKEYAYTEEVLPEAPLRTETGTYSSTWKDQLLNWNGTAMTYDAVGNMLTRGNITYIWTMRRKLVGVDNGKKTQYFYDHTGARVKKVVDGAVTEHHMAGDLIASETSNGKTMWYIYDSGANLLAVNIDGKYYTYVRNIQNDIIALVDASGKIVVNYVYDSWGKLLSITGSLKDTVGIQNPFRYRGYYYDNETGMYYLKNRYYDPGLRRFICSDEMGSLDIQENIDDCKLYSYCDNNPIARKDTEGDVWVHLLIGAATGFGVGAQMAVNAVDSIGGYMIGQALHGGIKTINKKDAISNGVLGGVSGFIGGSGANGKTMVKAWKLADKAIAKEVRRDSYKYSAKVITRNVAVKSAIKSSVKKNAIVSMGTNVFTKIVSSGKKYGK